MIFKILPIYHINSRRMKRKQDDEVEKDWEEVKVGDWQEVGREWEVGWGILRGWKSIPLDGVTSRAQLALARVSFRRGFRVPTVVHVFCQWFRFFCVDSYICI